jgi:bla regulator protein BlaR1
MMPTSLLNHLWQSTVFAAAAGLLTLSLRKNRAPVRYGLWFAASVKFLIPFSLLVTIGSRFEWRADPVATPIQLSAVIDQISEPFAPAAPAPVSAKKSPAVVSGPTILLMVWLCGFATVIFGWARQWWRVRQAMRAATPLHLDLPIRAVSSPERLEPGVFGIFRPVLLVPEGIADRLTPEQWRAILAHELCHVRRRDNLTAAVHMAVEAIFWLHPLVWWIGKRMVAERERACDEEVLLTASDPEVYAEGILNVCKLYMESPLACVSGVTGSNLKKRIRAIMTERVAGDLNFAKKLGLAVAGMAALAAPVAVGVMHAPRLLAQSSAQSPPPSVGQAIPIEPVKPPAAPRMPAQNQPQPEPAFDAASVRPADSSARRGMDFRVSGGRLVSTNWTLDLLVRQAYNVKYYQITDGPAWFNSDYFDIEGESPGDPGREQMMAMLRTLLADRFKLKVHRESKEGTVYALTEMKGGHKLKPAKEGDQSFVRTYRKTPPTEPGVSYFQLGQNASLAQLADTLTNLMRAPVTDRTGIPGTFDFRFDYGTDDAPAEAGPPVVTAIQDDLGLKLEKQKGPVEILVIDHAEKPSAN